MAQSSVATLSSVFDIKLIDVCVFRRQSKAIRYGCGYSTGVASCMDDVYICPNFAS